MLRARIIIWGLSLFLFASWLFSQEIDPPDLVGAIRSIEATLHQLQKEINDLHGSVKELSKAGKKKHDPRPADGPGSPDAPSSAPAWQLAHDAYERGRRAEDLKACGPAIDSFTRTIALDPKNDSAFLHRAYCYYDLGDYTSAISDLNQSLAIQPNNSRAYAKRASALSAAGQTAAAVLDANEAIQRDSNNPVNYLLRASLNQQLGNAPNALEDYSKAIASAPKSDVGYLARAAFYRAQGQVQKSLEDCYKAIQLNSANASGYVCRAQFYLATGAAQPALEDVSRAMLVEHNASETAALLRSAQDMLQSSQPAPAVTTVSTQDMPTKDAPSAMIIPAVAESTRPQPAVQRASLSAARSESRIANDKADFYRAGRAYMDEQKFEEAINAFNEAIRRNPNNALIRNARGYAYLRLRQYREALADFNEALRLNPGYGNASKNRSVAMESIGKTASSR